MKPFSLIKKLASGFCAIASGSLFAAAIFCSIFSTGKRLPASLLWEILGVAALCTLTLLVFYSKKELSKRQMFIRQVIHLPLLLLILLVCAYGFKWIEEPGFLQPLVFIALVLVVYLGVRLMLFRIESQLANRLNERLREYQQRKEAKGEKEPHTPFE